MRQSLVVRMARAEKMFANCCQAGSRFSHIQNISFNFTDQKHQIGRREAQAGRWLTVVFYVRRHVFVMRMSAGQRALIRVRLRIVPIKFLCATPDFVTITDNQQRFPINH